MGVSLICPRDGCCPTTACITMRKPCKSNARIDLRAGLPVGTWNVLTLNRTGYVTALVRTLKLRQMSLVGITEARLTGSNSTVVEGQTVLQSRGVHDTHRVDLVIAHRLVPCLIKWTPVSDRLLTAWCLHRHGHMTVIVTYSPTKDAFGLGGKEPKRRHADRFLSG